MPIADNIAKIHETIEKAEKTSLLAAKNPILLGVSKKQTASHIEEAISLGIYHFAENRVQEALEKWPAIKESHPNIELHLIGPLQTNKVKQALALFNVIQTLDRSKLAEAIAKEMERQENEEQGNDPSTPPHHVSAAARTSPEPRSMEFSGENSGSKQFLIQINTGEEPQKAGIAPKEADDFISYCKNDLKLSVTGLMCIPPADQPPAPHFALLREIRLRNGLEHLSMGMSSDYETAIRMGSTCVRIGTALFGKRPN